MGTIIPTKILLFIYAQIADKHKISFNKIRKFVDSLLEWNEFIITKINPVLHN